MTPHRHRLFASAVLAVAVALAPHASSAQGRTSAPRQVVKPTQNRRVVNPLIRLPKAQRLVAAKKLVQQHFKNTYGTDATLLQAVDAKVHGHGPSDSQLAQLTRGLTVKQQQVFALNVLARHSGSDTVTSAAVGKLGEMGDASSASSLKWAMFKGGEKTIPATVKAMQNIARRDPKFEKPRRVLDLSKYKNPQRAVEAVLSSGAIESVKPLSTDNHHAFDTYLVTFKNKVGGEPVRAVFKPTGPGHGQNWLRFSQNLHGRAGAYAFASREVFAYVFSKLIGMELVPPTREGLVDVPGFGKSFGSLQYFVPGSKALGHNWKDTRGEFQGFTASQAGIKQMDTMQAMSFIMGSVEHVPTNLMGGNKGNLLVAKKNGAGFPAKIEGDKKLMLIDNASGFTHKQYMSDNILPLRFDKQLVAGLKALKYDRFMKAATPFIGETEAQHTWNRIQHTLNVAASRPTW